MAVVVVGRVPNQDAYDQVGDRVMEGEQLPDGCRAHIAGPTGEGFRVITVWDSEEDFQRFRDEKLVPAIEEVTGGPGGPNAEVGEVYRFLTA
jgi:hypothetical protein